MCVWFGSQRSNFWSTLGPNISKNSCLWSFSQNVSTGFASVLVYMSIWASFRDVLNIGLRGPNFWVILRPKIFRFLVIFSQIFSTDFTSFDVLHAYWEYILVCFNVCFRLQQSMLGRQAFCFIIYLYINHFSAAIPMWGWLADNSWSCWRRYVAW